MGGERRAFYFAIALSALSTPVPAAERHSNRFHPPAGLSSPTFSSIAQSTDGFLWTASESGLFRFDGEEFLPWAAGKLRGRIDWLWAGPSGEVLALARRGEALLRITRDGVEGLPGPEGKPFEDVSQAVFDSKGRLWVAQTEHLFRRDSASLRWARMKLSIPAAGRIRALRPDRADGLLVVTSEGVWRVNREGATRLLRAGTLFADVIERADGSVLLLEKLPQGGRVLELRGRRCVEVFALAANGNNFAARGDAVWLGFDRYLAALRPGEAPEIIGPSDDAGGMVFVDREQSLWVVTSRGLLQFPEPDTRVWTGSDGLPSGHTRFLARTGEGLWVSTWQGLGLLIPSNRSRRGAMLVEAYKGPLCTDRHQVIWTNPPRSSGRFLTPWQGFVESCAVSADGAVWLGTDQGLFRSGPPGSAPQPARGAQLTGRAVAAILEDREGRLWVSAGGEICSGRIVRPIADVSDWSCSASPGGALVTSLIHTPLGAVWAATLEGVWHRSGSRWERLPDSGDLTALAVRLVTSRSGIWLLGGGGVVRIEERPELAAGWRVAERLTGWNGLPWTGVLDLIEEEGGLLWIATNAGVIEVPASARRQPAVVPEIELVSLNGRRGSAALPLRLASGDNRLELRFAALSYRDRGRLQYQYRLDPASRWTEWSGGRGDLRWMSLEPGEYTVEVRTSLNGENWSAAPIRIPVHVIAPWYRRPWAILLAGLALAAGAYLAHRARVGFLIQIEGQRNRIAMDLHDEIGSGLGSIGILSGLAAENSVDERQRVEIAARIAGTAQELGESLADIVWSLRADSSRLEALAAHLIRRGRQFFPDSKTILAADFPLTWPVQPLSLPVRRNLMRIAFEAMYNSARHANASHVALGIAPDGDRWRLWVADDGGGMPAAQHPAPTGMGLGNMRRRAAEIGADISWQSMGRGTTVTVRFCLDGSRTRTFMRWRGRGRTLIR